MSNNFNELNAAHAFVQVAQMGSFAKAAHLRGENPSSVSRAVAQLEKHLDAQLFVRSTRSVKLTDAGELYLDFAQKMLQLRSEASESLSLLNSGKPHGRVRISLPVVFSEVLTSELMRLFHTQYPDLQLEIDLSNRLAKLIEEGVDLAVRVGNLEDSSLRVKKLGAVRRHVYVSKNYAKAHGIPQTPADLPNHRTVSFATQGTFSDWTFWHRKTGKAHPPVPVRSWFTCNSPNMVLSMVRQGLGVGRGADWMAKIPPYRDELVEVLTDWQSEDPASGGVPIYLVFPPGPIGQLPLKTRVVADLIEQFIPQFMRSSP